MPIVHSSFRPAWWLRGGHLQTLWAPLVRFSPTVKRQRERLELEDGDFLDLDWQLEGEGPLIVVLHGLTGSSESKYVLGLQRDLKQINWRSVAINFRGCSGEPNRLPRSYHSGETGDLDFVVRLVQERFPNTPLGAVGFSLGGNVLLKWLGEKSRTCLFGAVAASVPLQLGRCSRHLEQGFAKVYMNRFVRDLRASLQFKHSHLTESGWSNHADTLKPFLSAADVKTLWDFDDVVTAPLHGFRDAEHYYDTCSSRQFVKDIALPTTIIHAVDDPFMPDDIFPTESELSDCVTLELTPFGGHVGFLTGLTPGRPRYWLEHRIVECLVSHYREHGFSLS